MKTPKFWYIDNSISKYVLYPLTALWLLGNYINKVCTRPMKFNVPIICVGNLIAGGGGKTPLVIEICKYYKKKKVKVHVVYKAYKVNLYKKALKVKKNIFNSNIEDEASLISNYTDTWLCKKRIYGIEAAVRSGANLIILDDGYQDKSVIKDVNIIVSNQMQGNGNKKVIPAGPLREPLSLAVRKSDCIFFYGRKKNFDENFQNYKKYVFFGNIDYKLKNISTLKKKKTIAFAGIAHPSNFFKLLSKNNFNVIEELSFPDHYRYTENDIEQILIKCKKSSAIPITTRKDFVKIPENLKKRFSVLDINVKFNKKSFFNFLNKKINFNV